MTKLNWQAGSVDANNDALITGAVKDVFSFTDRTASQVMNTVSPTALAAVDNTATLIRKPINTIGTWENYWKLAKTVPAVPMDIALKAFRLPFSRLDDALTYAVNNNLDRMWETAKALTTWLVANLISNNHQSRFKTLNAVATWIEGFGDIVTSVLKAPTGLLAKGTSIVDHYLGKGTEWTEWFLNGVRVTDKNFMQATPITHSADTPQVANDNRPPVANTNRAPLAEAA